MRAPTRWPRTLTGGKGPTTHPMRQAGRGCVGQHLAWCQRDGRKCLCHTSLLLLMRFRPATVAVTVHFFCFTREHRVDPFDA